jgi:hypothetical protein
MGLTDPIPTPNNEEIMRDRIAELEAALDAALKKAHPLLRRCEKCESLVVANG